VAAQSLEGFFRFGAQVVEALDARLMDAHLVSCPPGEWFTGAVYVDAVAAPSGRSRLSASSVHFTPGARTAWHTHPNGQTIYVTEGVGVCQRRGGAIEVIRPGDRVFFEPREDHWHGATRNRFMSQRRGVRRRTSLVALLRNRLAAEAATVT
jgi:quercetin dioxygenase-like cupin family protein